MHDPMTVAFEIKRPWPKRYSLITGKTYRSWPALITIWHCDPERDGTDDSCGWARLKLNNEQKSLLRHFAWCEAHNPWLMKEAKKKASSPANAELLMRGIMLNVSSSFKLSFSWEEICKLACEYIHDPIDNFRGRFCFLPGWHSNFKEDDPKHREDEALSLYFSVARLLLRKKRPWWKHPRFHFWHWKIQFHFLPKWLRRNEDTTNCDVEGKYSGY